MTEDSLWRFFDMVHANQKANCINFAEWYDILKRIDECFVRAGENLNYSEENLLYPKTETTITGNLLLRCQYASGWPQDLRWLGKSLKPS
jgi:hypothetical protein